jgi:hypothetical protein
VRTERIRVCVAVLGAAALLLAHAARAEGEPPAPPPSRSTGEVAWAVLAYLPNRAFDLSDIVRLHARVGTGFGVGARVTQFLPVFAGDYRAFWVGLPGPRGRPKLPIPVGLEGQKGVQVGPLRTSTIWRTPEYGVGEVGGGVMVYALGVEIGLDPYELGDFLAGFATVDFARDDF